MEVGWNPSEGKGLNKFIKNSWDEILVYMVTVASILMSQYIEVLKSGEDVEFTVQTGKLLVAMFVALMITLKAEEVKGSSDQEKTVARNGKRKNLGARLYVALSSGMMWPQIIGLAT